MGLTGALSPMATCPPSHSAGLREHTPRVATSEAVGILHAHSSHFVPQPHLRAERAGRKSPRRQTRHLSHHCVDLVPLHLPLTLVGPTPVKVWSSEECMSSGQVRCHCTVPSPVISTPLSTTRCGGQMQSTPSRRRHSPTTDITSNNSRHLSDSWRAPTARRAARISQTLHLSAPPHSPSNISSRSKPLLKGSFSLPQRSITLFRIPQRPHWSPGHPTHPKISQIPNASGNGEGGSGGAGDEEAKKCSTGSSSPRGAEWSKGKSRKELLLEYVDSVQPEFIDRFFQKADEQVVDAMRQTVSNMLGTLPPQFFEVTVSTVGENLAQLMFSVMMTGYMFRNAQYRLELASVVAMPALGAPSAFKLLPGNEPGSESPLHAEFYADGSQKSHVSGEVLRWNAQEQAVESVGAVEYIEMLEGEVQRLQVQLEGERALKAEGVDHNPLLHFLKHLEPKNIEALTASAAGDALEAMNAFIRRLLGVPDLSEIKSLKSRTTVAEMARLLYWLMVVGYSLRSLEVRYDMEQAMLGAPAMPKSLPPTEDS